MTATNKVGFCASMSVSSVSQMPLVIMGATGMVGGYAVRYALDSPAFKSMTSTGRKKLSILHPKLKEVLHQNLADRLAHHGYTINPRGGDALPGDVHAELRTITAGYTIELARVLRNSSPNDDFSFLSGSGADRQGEAGLPFARHKGEAEKALLAAGFPRVYLFRPAYICPVQARKEPNFSYRLIRAVYPLFRLLFPHQVVRADDLAWAIVDVLLRETQGAP
jgi:hypothetical protein